MRINRLQLNTKKTESLWIRPRTCVHLQFPSISIGGVTVEPVKSARNLGFYFDEHLDHQQQILNLSKSCFFQLRQIRTASRHLSPDVLKSVLQAFIASRLDYCNALYIGLPQASISKLQRLQNCAARVYAKSRKFDHITPVLRDQLHWLPVSWRIQHKVATTVYKILHGQTAAYLSSYSLLAEPTASDITLRSASHYDIVVRRSNSHRFGDRIFFTAAPNIWNNLPPHLRRCDTIAQFSSGLKTELFLRAYQLR